MSSTRTPFRLLTFPQKQRPVVRASHYDDQVERIIANVELLESYAIERGRAGGLDLVESITEKLIARIEGR